jgi:UDP-N-acetylglucosamine 2-epimerase (non-hydrolysing)
VVGTRPEAIKLAPVARALAARGLSPLIVLTGQQPLEHGEFGLGTFEQVRLGCPGREDPNAHVHAVTAAMLPLLAPASPALLVVQGDTSTALGAALAGFIAGVPVAHVEAGLRTHDPRLPWPEEEFRTAIDARADLLFAPTESAGRNLAGENVEGEVHLTGNSGIDALFEVMTELPARPLRESARPRLLVTCHRRESWGEGLDAIATALAELAGEAVATVELVLHPNAHVAARMRALLARTPNVELIAPCSHRELVRRMRGADLILSDSGGIQEEAPALGTPLLVLRDKTERPEAIAHGNARLVGTSAERIVEEVRRLLGDPLALAAMARPALPFGDGRAAPRIAAIVENWLDRRALSPVSSRRPRHLGNRHQQ